MLAIYNHVMATSTAIYREEPATLEAHLEWFSGRAALGYPVLVATDEAGIAGCASFGDFRPWPGYRFTVEHSVDAENPASLRFHQRLGFVSVAHFREVGFKFGRCLDLMFLQRIVGDDERA